MTDTSLEVDRLFSQFLMAKSVTERFQMGFEMMNDGRRIVECAIRRQHPDWSAGELKAAVFKRIYQDDFSADEMVRIKESLMAYEQRQANR